MVYNLSSFGLDGWLRQAQTGAPPYPGLPIPCFFGVSFSSKGPVQSNKYNVKGSLVLPGPRSLICRMRGLD